MRSAARKKGGADSAPWQKVKFDRQIVAIAKVHGVATIYSDDLDIKKHGRDCGLQVLGSEDLAVKPGAQGDLSHNRIPRKGRISPLLELVCYCVH